MAVAAAAPRKPPGQHGHEQIVEHHVGGPGQKVYFQAEARLFRRHKKGLEHCLQHERALRQKQNAPVHHALLHQRALHAQQGGYLRREGEAQPAEHRARADGDIDDEGKVAVGKLAVALAQRFGHNGAAARAQHEADGRDAMDTG